MKIHIFYRHYNVSPFSLTNPSRPQGFSYEKSFNNLLETIRGYPNVELTVMMDGNKQNTFLEKYDVKVYEFKGGSDSTSFFQTVKYAKNKTINSNDLIYFLENDYLHMFGWIEKVIELFSTFKGLSYVSLYDHNDKYFLPIYKNLLSQIITTKTHHWRTTPSTCGSFIISKQILDEDYDILSTMEGDHNKFLWLNQNRKRSVITPIPGLSTHCMKDLMSPTIDWEKINN
jgi:hypothetical protein